MAKFICIENNEVTSILDYFPNVPDSIIVQEISDEDSEKIISGYYYYDIKKRKVLEIQGDDLKQLVIRDNNIKNQNILNDTDWIILRHLREKALNIATSISDAEYLETEKLRQQAAKAIVN